MGAEPDSFAPRLFKGQALVCSCHAAQATSGIIAHVVGEQLSPELAQDYLRRPDQREAREHRRSLVDPARLA